MTYEQAENYMANNLKVVNTNGNDNFPYYINRLLIMPTEITYEDELDVIKWAIVNNHEFKKAFEIAGVADKEDFDVYVVSNNEEKPQFLLLREYYL